MYIYRYYIYIDTVIGISPMKLVLDIYWISHDKPPTLPGSPWVIQPCNTFHYISPGILPIIYIYIYVSP